MAESRTREEEGLATDTKTDDEDTQQTSEGGRIKALQDLHADGQSLAGLQAPGASLGEIDLSSKIPWFCFERVKQRFPQTCYPFTDLYSANFRGANLGDAKLQRAWLYDAILQQANLQLADLTQASLQLADLTQAVLWKTDLIETNLTEANLTEANLRADLRSR
ncbi:MAG: pentapeptide repeat-containing protein [Prochlorothrix sp.]